jgi:hypothetical protein
MHLSTRSSVTVALIAAFLVAAVAPAQAAFLSPDPDFGAQIIGNPIGAPWGPVSGAENSATASAQSPFTNVLASNGIGANSVASVGNPYFVGGFTSIPAAATGNYYLNVDFRNNSTESGDYSLVVTDGANGAIISAALYVSGGGLYAQSNAGVTAIMPIAPSTWYNAQLNLNLTNNTYSGVVTPQGGTAVNIASRGFVTENSIGTIYTDGGTNAVGGPGPDHDIDNFVFSDAPLTAPASLALAQQVVNIDFNGFRPGDVVGPTYAGPGAGGGGPVFNGIPVDSTTGNDNVSVSTTNLLNAQGVPTAVGFAVSPVGGDVGGPATGNGFSTEALFSDYVFDHSAGNQSDSPFSITGLGSATRADLYIYHSTADSTISVNGASPSPFTPNSIFSVANTLYFKDVPVVNGTITGNFGNGQTAVINGLSIVTAVPEPGTIALLVSACLALPLLRRRRRS